MAKTERDRIAAKARQMARDPATAAAWRLAWGRVLDRLAPVYAARRPLMKSFEVHHSNEVAREAMLRALVNGMTIADAETISFDSANNR